MFEERARLYGTYPTALQTSFLYQDVLHLCLVCNCVLSVWSLRKICISSLLLAVFLMTYLDWHSLSLKAVIVIYVLFFEVSEFGEPI